MIRIKKYGNRRLYDTERSRYVNLDEIAAMIREGQTIQVLDASSGEDLTRAVLLQVLLEEQSGAALFPASLLHRVIRASGEHPAQKMLFQQLGQALSLVDAQLLALEEQFPWMKAGAWPGARPGPARAAEPAPEPPPEGPTQAPPPEPPRPAPDADAELAALRARLASLEARLKKG